MKDNVIQPLFLSGDYIVQFSQSFKYDKNLLLTVPVQYKAFVYINEKLAFRVDPCQKLNLLKEYGKDYQGANVRVAFILASNLPSMAWGFGNIEVNNEKLHEAYRVGANGKYLIEITDYVKLISKFNANENITIEDIREKSISALKTVGTPLLSRFFAKTDVSVFQVSSLIGDLREQMIQALSTEEVFKLLGIKLISLTIDGIHVNDDDIEAIRNRINKEEPSNEEI